MKVQAITKRLCNASLAYTGTAYMYMYIHVQIHDIHYCNQFYVLQRSGNADSRLMITQLCVRLLLFVLILSELLEAIKDVLNHCF